MQGVDLRNDNDRHHEEEQEMPEDEVRREHAQLGDLAQELATGLREGVPAHRVPLASPECNVRFVRLELSGQGQADDELKDEALDGDDRDHAGQSPCEVELLEVVHDLEEHEHHDDGDTVGDGR